MLKTIIQYVALTAVVMGIIFSTMLAFPVNSGMQPFFNASVMNNMTVIQTTNLNWTQQLHADLQFRINNSFGGGLTTCTDAVCQISLGFGALAALTLNTGIIFLSIPAQALDGFMTATGMLTYGIDTFLPSIIGTAVKNALNPILIVFGALIGISIILWILEAVLGRKFE